MVQTTAQLSGREVFGASQELRLHAPDLARHLEPGQAILILTGWGVDPYLRRTFHPIAFDAVSYTLRLPPGGDRGHAWLRLAPVGTQLDCLGPVGRGFHIPSGIRNLLCLGEGELGWTLLPAVAQADAQGLAITLALEAVSARNAIPAHRLPTGVEYRLSTRDSRQGPHERLAARLPELLTWADVVLAAGSPSFYQQLAEAIRQTRVILSRGFAQTLYPANFLCGFGACHACAVDIAGGRRRVCLRGPVFDLVDMLR